MPGRKVQAGWSGGLAPGASGCAADPTIVDLTDGVPAQPTAYGSYPSERLARVILLTVLCGFVTVELISVIPGPRPSHGLVVAVGIASICVLFTLQVFNSSPAAARWPMPRRVAMLLAQALVTYLPLLVLGRQWGGMAGWLAGSILLLIS